MLLLHGLAGSGKSTAAKKIEYCLWEQRKVKREIFLGKDQKNRYIKRINSDNTFFYIDYSDELIDQYKKEDEERKEQLDQKINEKN